MGGETTIQEKPVNMHVAHFRARRAALMAADGTRAADGNEADGNLAGRAELVAGRFAFEWALAVPARASATS